MASLTPESGQEQKLSVGESLRRHRVWLLGLGLFPVAAFLGSVILGCPSELFEPLILLCFVLFVPLWDYSRCREPSRLWLVAMGLWMASFCLAGLFGCTGMGG